MNPHPVGTKRLKIIIEEKISEGRPTVNGHFLRARWRKKTIAYLDCKTASAEKIMKIINGD